MRVNKFFLCTAGILFIFSISGQLTKSYAQGKEKKVLNVKLPSEVDGAFKKAFPNAKIEKTAKEEVNNITYYEIACTYDTLSINLFYTTDGKLYKRVEEISKKEIGKTIKKAIRKDFEAYKIKTIEKTTKGSDISFKVILKKDNERLSVIYDGSGRILDKKELKAKKNKQVE